MKKLTTLQFKSGIMQSECFYCPDADFLRYSFSIAYYHYCKKYFVNFADLAKNKYFSEQFDTAKEAYSFLEKTLNDYGLKSKY